MVLWIKALHIVAVISWMAGLLYLPRLFVYHAEAGPNTPQSATFKVMEHRLLRYIMNPAMTVVWITGPLLAYLLYVYYDVWMILKFILVCALTAYHHALVRWRKAFFEDRNQKPGRYFRIANEIPTLLMVGIVILVVVKPF
ncbi:MAG: protoporphyrinogen oxidase HemJ [Hyphomicrobiales bacterium]|nr:MAG: protoporphyrinogen oxidase HemJ [Hyphomicrobiales bacterium]